MLDLRIRGSSLLSEAAFGAAAPFGPPYAPPPAGAWAAPAPADRRPSPRRPRAIVQPLSHRNRVALLAFAPPPGERRRAVLSRALGGRHGAARRGARAVWQSHDARRRAAYVVVLLVGQRAVHQVNEGVGNLPHPRGVGGFDFCVADNKDIYILDINTGRFTGSHIPILFMKNNHFSGHYVFTTLETEHISFETLKQKLDSIDIPYEIIAFSPTKSKIILHYFSYNKVHEYYQKILDIQWKRNTTKKSFFRCRIVERFNNMICYIVSALSRKRTISI